MKEIFHTSITALFIKYIQKSFRNAGAKLRYLSDNSCSQKIIRKIVNSTRFYFRYSFFGKISELPVEYKVLNNSRAIEWLSKKYKKTKRLSIGYTATSVVIQAAGKIKQQLSFLTVRKLGIIIFTAVLINIILSIFLNKEIRLLGWILRLLFLFTGIFSLLCPVSSCKDLKRTSFIIGER